MKKIILPLVLVSLALSACTMPWSHKDDSESAKNTTKNTTHNKPHQDQKVYTLNYTLKDGEHSVDAKNNFQFTPGSKRPFFASGMDDLVATMKAGEKKSVKLAAEKLYGPSTLTNTGNLEQFVDTFTTTGSIDAYADRITASLPKTQVLKNGKSDYKVGDEVQVMGAIGIPPGPAKVEKIEGDIVTVSAENRMNPFVGKKIQVGTEGKGGNNQNLRIEKVEGKVVTIKHTNPSNHAFAGVEVKVGAEWTNERGQQFHINAIDGNSVGYSFTTGNKLAGKELTLEVEVLSIK